jgi:putative SOS response-associated peptidase YedK
MCYDMSFFSNIKLIADYLNLQPGEEISFEPTYHKVAQSFCPWPVVINDGGYKIKIFEWGLIADYMNTPEKIKDYRTSMANARSEKMIDDKRSVWHRLKKNRCLVFTTGFYEHRDIGAKKKLPYFIKLKGQEIFCLAGLYNYSPIPDPETGEMTGTFSVITREANSLMKTIHNSGPNSGRMPLILDKERALKWLDPDLKEAEIKLIAEYEYPAEQLEAWPVNTIRTRRNDDASFIEKVVVEGID